MWHLIDNFDIYIEILEISCLFAKFKVSEKNVLFGRSYNYSKVLTEIVTTPMYSIQKCTIGFVPKAFFLVI